MPGPIVHLQNVEGLSPYLRELGGDNGQALADLLDADPCSPYTGMGAQGPDFLFFSLKEYGTPLDELVNFIFGAYDAVEPFIEFYEKTVQPVENAIDAAIQAVDEAALQGLIGDIGKTADLISSTLLAVIARIATDNVDFFYPFYPKQQQGDPEDQWYWFDIWHYRRTGRFASTLWRLANEQNDDDLRRYAIGYGSHIGGDVGGHPFVNAIVGGPYRSHWHRHHLIENWIDAFAKNTYPDAGDMLGCLGLASSSSSISSSQYYRLCQFPDDELPGKLADLFVKAVDETYAGSTVPVTFSGTDFDTTYRLWLMWFKRLTTIGSAEKPTPVPPPGSATLTLINDFFSNFPSPPGFSGGGGGGGFSVWDLFAAVLKFLEWVAKSAAYTVDWIINHASDIVTLPLTEALALIKWLLYQIRKQVWTIYEESRFALVLGAYFVPEPRDFNRVPWGTAFINTASAGLTGGPTPYFLSPYPRKQESHGLFGPTEHHLIYPGTLRERPFSEAAPAPFYGTDPSIILSGWHPYDPQIEQTYTATAPYGSGPAFTHWTDWQTWTGYQFGSLREFSARLIGNHIDDLPNFSLDGDRGYAWKTWRADEPDIENQNPVPVTFIDT